MKAPMQKAPARGESRLLVALTIVAILAMLEAMPARVRVMPAWFPYAAAIVLLIPVLGYALTRTKILALVERVVVYAFFALSLVLIVLTLTRLIDTILSPTKELGGVALLASAIAVWFINVLAFALVYWEIDRGGPIGRANDAQAPPDILFPENPADSKQRFAFMDYLFFAYTTSTAFSPTETYPITSRMKALMMVQSMISLVTIVIIAGRAINILK